MKYLLIVFFMTLLGSCQKSAEGKCVGFVKNGQVFVIEIFDAPNSSGLTDRDYYLQPERTIKELRKSALESPCNKNINN